MFCLLIQNVQNVFANFDGYFSNILDMQIF